MAQFISLLLQFKDIVSELLVFLMLFSVRAKLPDFLRCPQTLIAGT